MTMQKINASDYSPPNVNYWGDRCCKAEAEAERLRKGIKDYIEGSAPTRIAKTDKCSHGRYGYEECGSCIDDYFANLLLPNEPSVGDK